MLIHYPNYEEHVVKFHHHLECGPFNTAVNAVPSNPVPPVPAPPKRDMTLMESLGTGTMTDMLLSRDPFEGDDSDPFEEDEEGE